LNNALFKNSELKRLFREQFEQGSFTFIVYENGYNTAVITTKLYFRTFLSFCCQKDTVLAGDES
jgi:hypothetical protein